MDGPSGKERCVTSSLIPMVNLFLSVLLYTATICAGVVSLDPKPYLPERIVTFLNSLVERAATTSKYKGSPIDPGYLVRSNTEIVFTVFGIAFKKASTANGR